MLSLDSGCEGDCIRVDECYRLGIQIKPLDYSDNQIPTQADGTSPLDIVGKVKFEIERDKLVFKYEGYAAKNLQAGILGGGAFQSSGLSLYNFLIGQSSLIHDNRV